MEGKPVVVIILLLTNLVFVATATNFSFSSFQADDGSLLKVDDVRWSSTLQSFELNYRTYATGLLDQECGRLLYKDKVRLFDRRSGISASFNTSFSFAFQQSLANSTNCGAGLAFTFVPGTTITDREYSRRGKGMCAFDNADTSVSNRIVAVKFDSALTNITSYHDPSDSNIGLVVTDKGNTTDHTYNLCGNITECAFFCGNKGVFSAWIDYDSVSHVLEVRFRAGSLFSGGGKPDSPLIRVTDLRLDSDVLEDEEMYVGFSGSTFWSREVHRIQAWSFNSSVVPTSSDDPPRPPLVAIVGIACAVVFGAALVGIIIVFFFWHKKSSEGFSLQSKNLSFSNTAPRSFTYKELRKATKNFSASELLSSGSFGDVYKGTLMPSGALVSVKRIKSSNEEGEESFLAEATSLRQIRHRNLLQLRGWCQEKQGLLLVYDYLSNGSLDKWLHRSNPRGTVTTTSAIEALPWSVRRFILVGVSSALAYLHEEWVQCILHRDIKSSNVMLDANFNAYLGDFGLARLVDHHKVEKTTLLAGTLGYMAPEMTYTGRATKETDIYAFGILVLEVVCGRRPLAVQEQDSVLLDCVWRAYEAGSLLSVADSRLTGADTVIEEEEKVIVKTLELGLLCCHPNPAERPSMRMVNQWFQAAGSIDLPALPATRPFSQYSDMILGLRTSSEEISTSTVNSFQQWPSSDTGSF